MRLVQFVPAATIGADVDSSPVALSTPGTSRTIASTSASDKGVPVPAPLRLPP